MSNSILYMLKPAAFPFMIVAPSRSRRPSDHRDDLLEAPHAPVRFRGELWPAEVDGKQQTLIWRADFVSTSSIPFLKGIERLAAENIMLLEVKKSIGAFVKEASR